jgi:hypothetical protein
LATDNGGGLAMVMDYPQALEMRIMIIEKVI